MQCQTCSRFAARPRAAPAARRARRVGRIPAPAPARESLGPDGHAPDAAANAAGARAGAGAAADHEFVQRVAIDVTKTERRRRAAIPPSVATALHQRKAGRRIVMNLPPRAAAGIAAGELAKPRPTICG